MSARPLRAVDHEGDETVGPEYQEPRQAALMEFEGVPVHFTSGKVTSASKLEIQDRVLKMDQKIVMVLELRVNDVDHKVDETSGKVTRVHGLKAIDAFICDTDFETLRNSGL